MFLRRPSCSLFCIVSPPLLITSQQTKKLSTIVHSSYYLILLPPQLNVFKMFLLMVFIFLPPPKSHCTSLTHLHLTHCSCQGHVFTNNSSETYHLVFILLALPAKFSTPDYSVFETFTFLSFTKAYSSIDVFPPTFLTLITLILQLLLLCTCFKVNYFSSTAPSSFFLSSLYLFFVLVWFFSPVQHTVSRKYHLYS